jgi:hypothetical protein
MLSTPEIDLIDKITPGNSESYLKNKGWIHTKNMGCDATVWEYSLENGDLTAVLVPKKTEFIDYRNRIIDILSILRKVEDRSLESIAKDILSGKIIFPYRDIQRRYSSGTIISLDRYF